MHNQLPLSSLPGTGEARRSPGFGLGLRTEHYQDFLQAAQPLDWLEVISDNFLLDGGKPLQMLERFRRDYPIALHGVAMSIGSASGLNLAYLDRLRALADRIDAMWVSDHLCWTGISGHALHDLYPLPYTEEAAGLLIAHIRQAQDRLGRRLVVENVSSYVRFTDSQISEAEFLAYVANQADCELLLDINNVYVSSINHGFDAREFLRRLPAGRVRQFHLAGHSMSGEFIIDTHDHPVADAVWQLYADACKLFGPTATMIERDDRIPPLPELLAELNIARQIAAQSCQVAAPPAGRSSAATAVLQQVPGEQRGFVCGAAAISLPATSLPAVQQAFAGAVLAPEAIEFKSQLPLCIDPDGPLTGQRGMEIYHNAYRARLGEVLAEHFPKLLLYVGSDYFDQLSLGYIQTHAPEYGENISRYGGGFADYLQLLHPDHPELFELASLEWVLRTRFDAADQPAWTLDLIQQQGPAICFEQWPVLHPSLQYLTMYTNAVAIWRAIDDDQPVPEVHRLSMARTVLVWRHEWQPNFVSIDALQADFLRSLALPDYSISAALDELPEHCDETLFSGWLQQWWSLGLLRLPLQAGAAVS